MDPEVCIERPQSRSDKIEQIVWIQRQRIGVAEEGLSSCTIGVDQGNLALSQDFGLKALQRQMAREDISSVEGF